MLGASSTNGARGRAVRRLCAPAAGVTKKVMNVSACLAGASTGRWVEAGRRRSAGTPPGQASGTTTTKGGGPPQGEMSAAGEGEGGGVGNQQGVDADREVPAGNQLRIGLPGARGSVDLAQRIRRGQAGR